MKLFVNVDITNLRQILKEGLLPISKTGNDNWEPGKRADNSKEVVYLFAPKTEVNYFPKYGIALLEVEVEAEENELMKHDHNGKLYTEFITTKVKPEEIKKIYIPRILKEALTDYKLYDEWGDFVKENYTDLPIDWVEMKVDDCYNRPVNEETLELFAKTANLSTNDDNFFRGVNSDRTSIDFYNHKLEIKEN